MPTYDLTCRECGHRFERFLTRLLRDEDRTCPECGAPDAKKGIGGGFLGAGTRASSSPPASSCGPGRFS